jgi:RAD51-like protein 2
MPWSSFFGRVILLSLAIFVINQMTTKIGIAEDSDQTKGTSRSRLIPALGESWAHSTTSRLILSYSKVHPGARECRLVKSPHKPTGVAMFNVTTDGIRDYLPIGKSDIESNKRPRAQA